jgi:hypothetical protein
MLTFEEVFSPNSVGSPSHPLHSHVTGMNVMSLDTLSTYFLVAINNTVAVMRTSQLGTEMLFLQKYAAYVQRFIRTMGNNSEHTKHFDLMMITEKPGRSNLYGYISLIN